MSHDALKPGLSAAYAVLTAVVTVFGVVNIYDWVAAKTSGWFYPVLAVVVILGVCTAFFVPIFRRRFNTYFGLQQATPYVVQDARWTWRIATDCSAVVESVKKLVFVAPPRPADLSDMAFGSETFKMHKDIYSSTDSRIVNVRKVAKGRMRVYWAPLAGAVTPAVPYEHQCRFTFPAPDECRDEKTITIASPVYAGKLEMDLTSDIPIREVQLARGREDDFMESPAAISAYLNSVEDTHAPIPTVEGNRVRFTLHDLAPRHAYYLRVAFDRAPARVAA